MSDKDNSKASLAGRKTTKKLPIPSLEETADHFTRWFTPLLDNEQRAETRAALNKFVKPKGLAERLHKKLLANQKKNRSNSWLDEYWQNRFLARRDPLMQADNYFFLFAHEEMSREKRAASLVAAVLNYKLVLDQGVVPRIVEKTTPLCEEQFDNLFAVTRLPGIESDKLQKYRDKASPLLPSSHHIAVFCQGNIFKVDLVSEDGLPYTISDIEESFAKICLQCLDEQITGRAIGYLTSMQRADWARTRKTLINASPDNAINLQIVESALFTVHLDHEQPEDHQAACQALMAGNGGNRWFDKSLQFIVFKNGMAGLNVERSGLDRATLVDFLNYVLGIDPQAIDQYSGAVPQGMAKTERLTFVLNPAFQKKITMAAALYEQKRSELVTRVMEFDGFDNGRLTSSSITADALAQCALQLAHARLGLAPAAICQNVSMRHHTSGRVQHMWVTSSQMMDFIELAQAHEPDPSRIHEAFELAAVQHVVRTKDCRQGTMPVLHLTELLNIYNRHPEAFSSDFLTRLTTGGLSQAEIDEALQFYSSSGWMRMKDKACRTSFLAAPALLHHGFCSLDRGNIAIGCLIDDHRFYAHLTAAQDSRTCSTNSSLPGERRLKNCKT